MKDIMKASVRSVTEHGAKNMILASGMHQAVQRIIISIAADAASPRVKSMIMEATAVREQHSTSEPAEHADM